MGQVVKDSQSPRRSFERTVRTIIEDCLKARPSREPVNKSNSVEVKQSKIIIEHRAEKETDRPAEDQSGEQARENSIQSQHI